MSKLKSTLDVKRGDYLRYKFDVEGQGVLVKKILEATKERVKFEGVWVGYGDLKQEIEIAAENIGNWDVSK